jgi:apolipoprotein N-acyltransferase
MATIRSVTQRLDLAFETAPAGSCAAPQAWLRTSATMALAVTAVGAFELAYETTWGAPAVVLYLGSLFALAWVKTTRRAFYLGMLIGTSLAALQLTFMSEIFGPAAIGLWMILGVWTGIYLLLARTVVERWPTWGLVWIPILWMAVEYFRSELYYLRFAWVTPGWALGHPPWKSGLACGVYGASALIMSALVLLCRITYRRVRIAGVIVGVLFVSQVWSRRSHTPRDSQGPLVVGIQLENVTPEVVAASLMQAVAEHPNADLFLLSEYTFGGPVPPEFGEWCREHKKYLIAGGKEPLDEYGTFLNTAYVIGPSGNVEFEQSKSVPIQFFNDGLPARRQRTWISPWGRIGIAICYDLSYARVMDRLVEQGAEGLIIPAVDAQDWGVHEHQLHARIAPARAFEYGLPIFRLASSGISQLVDSTGSVLATASYPGQGEKIVGRFPMRSRGRMLPVDRYVAVPAVGAVVALLLYLFFKNLEARLLAHRRENRTETQTEN